MQTGSRALQTVDMAPSQPLTVYSDVARLAEAHFRKSSYRCLRNMICNYHEGVLTIRGTVPTFYMKQMAYVLARQVDRVELVVDRVQVAQPAEASHATKNSDG